MADLKASEELKTWIKTHEGFTPVAIFDDYAGTPDVVEMAIGHGHQIQPGQEYLYTATITRDQATVLMEADLKVWETFINTNVQKKLNQKQFDALVNLCYAVGGGNAWPVINLINEGASIQEIAKKWLSIGTYWQGKQWPALVAMREREVEMYKAGSGNIVLIIFAAGLLITGLFYAAKKI